LAVGLLVQKGFELFHLEMIYVHFGDFNVAARHLYERMGFRQVPLRESTDGPWVNRTCKIVRMELERSLDMKVAMMQTILFTMAWFF